MIDVWKEYGAPNPVITSGNDGLHKKGSLHYFDSAIDLRGNNMSNELREKLKESLRQRLGPDYDVLNESFPDAPSKDHIHIEYDPKT